MLSFFSLFNFLFATDYSISEICNKFNIKEIDIEIFEYFNNTFLRKFYETINIYEIFYLMNNIPNEQILINIFNRNNMNFKFNRDNYKVLFHENNINLISYLNNKNNKLKIESFNSLKLFHLLNLIDYIKTYEMEYSSLNRIVSFILYNCENDIELYRLKKDKDVLKAPIKIINYLKKFNYYNYVISESWKIILKNPKKFILEEKSYNLSDDEINSYISSKKNIILDKLKEVLYKNSELKKSLEKQKSTIINRLENNHLRLFQNLDLLNRNIKLQEENKINNYDMARIITDKQHSYLLDHTYMKVKRFKWDQKYLKDDEEHLLREIFEEFTFGVEIYSLENIRRYFINYEGKNKFWKYSTFIHLVNETIYQNDIIIFSI